MITRKQPFCPNSLHSPPPNAAGSGKSAELPRRLNFSGRPDRLRWSHWVKQPGRPRWVKRVSIQVAGRPLTLSPASGDLCHIPRRSGTDRHLRGPSDAEKLEPDFKRQVIGLPLRHRAVVDLPEVPQVRFCAIFRAKMAQIATCGRYGGATRNQRSEAQSVYTAILWTSRTGAALELETSGALS